MNVINKINVCLFKTKTVVSCLKPAISPFNICVSSLQTHTYFITYQNTPRLH